MADILVMPKLSDTMEEGVIAKWRKKEGDQVKDGEILAEIETDKATMEYESPKKGVILKIIAQPGKRLKLKEPICVVGQLGEKFELPAAGTASAAAAPAPEKSPTKPGVSPVSQVVSPVASAPKSAPAAGGRTRSSPLARKVAHDKGINLDQIHGSGPGGRIVIKDLDGASAGAGGASGRPAARTTSGNDVLVPVTMMRQTIAKRLLAAKNEAPHFYLTVACNMKAVNAWRKKLNDEAEKNPALPKVSVNDIVMMAASKALEQHPQVNASWEGENIRQYGNVHMAMAVALPTGLITPVIRHSNQLPVREIAKQSRDLAGRAKAGSLKPEDYVGGTFTVSNLGMLGIEEFTAIINPPQVAILAVGATIMTPVVSEKGDIVVAPIMKLTMSCDHRVVDGALGAAYLKTLVTFLEDPVMMLA